MKYVHVQEEHNTEAAKVIFPFVFDLFSPNAVLDVGCGIGTWLSIAKELGALKILGVDGEYVNRKLLGQYVKENEFLPHDLQKSLQLNQLFDLVLCLEVAEHLPLESSDILVKSLVDHSDVILFSAAIPGQGGQNHINEQWPEYWAQKFTDHGYVFLDIIRPLIWNSPKVHFWYKQNIFLVVKNTHEFAKKYPHSNLALVHPEFYQANNKILDNKINSLQNQLAVHPLKRWIKKLIS